jgi:hypothetical protein
MRGHALGRGTGELMSATGHLQTFDESKRMSALPPIADIAIEITEAR